MDQLLTLPISPRDFVDKIVAPALALLPDAMDTPQARVMLTAIALQESALNARRQMPTGPARGLLQFEEGTRASRGGVWGVYLHEASRFWLDRLCRARGVPFAPREIWSALETDDVLAAGVARLLLFTDPRRLPAIHDTNGAWDLYARTWRPGKPHPTKWPDNHRRARQAAGVTDQP
ncbi:hypothetical protein [Cupriavidus oxalaticus]|uniref:Transglycosylase SLT domain-containing protein n=1 Tax=Cupriavidus oxalaticus TaxID=96344 RepID=A0A5P3VPJ6_9BURK|nr:hypothetical protein [Cupriavidus oxalaticus]QEZ47171.1 hypothetical protein D2917_23760 [Cupriavidus oxalaticus]